MTAKPAAAQDVFATQVQVEVVRLLGGGAAFLEFIRRHPSYMADLWGFALSQIGSQLSPLQVAAIWYAQCAEPQLENDAFPVAPCERYLRQGREDLAAAREVALTLRNQCGDQPGGEEGEDPWVEEIRQEDGSWTCRVLVADGCIFCEVPPFEGQTMRSAADAIAQSGRVILDLLVEVERSRKANQALLAYCNGQTPTETP